MVVNSLHTANQVQLHARATVTKDTAPGFSGGQQLGTPYAACTSPFFSPIFAPCQKPTYGEMAAVNLNTRQMRMTLMQRNFAAFPHAIRLTAHA